MAAIEKKSPIEAAKKACEEVGQINPGDTNQMAAKLQQMILDYYRVVSRQAQQSFYSALTAATIGTIFFVYAAWLEMQSQNISSKISLIAGALIQVISAINFFLYGKATRQFSLFHICLERFNRFILANSLCDNISCGVKKDITRQNIVESILNAPMLTLDSKETNDRLLTKINSYFDKAEVNLEPSLS